MLHHSQPPLFPPEAIHLKIDVGVVPRSDLLQTMYTIISPSDGQILRMESRPGRRFHALKAEYHIICSQAMTDLLQHCEPF